MVSELHTAVVAAVVAAVQAKVRVKVWGILEARHSPGAGVGTGFKAIWPV